MADYITNHPLNIIQFRTLDLESDLPRITDIEERSFDIPWRDWDFKHNLRHSNVISLAALSHNIIVGYIIYKMHDKHIELINLAIHPNWRLSGIGKMLVNHVICKLSLQEQVKAVLTIRETNLSAQLFFKKMKFKAVKVVHCPYENSDEDAYMMEHIPAGFEYKDQPAPFPKGINRISQYYNN